MTRSLLTLCGLPMVLFGLACGDEDRSFDDRGGREPTQGGDSMGRTGNNPPGASGTSGSSGSAGSGGAGTGDGSGNVPPVQIGGSAGVGGSPAAGGSAGFDTGGSAGFPGSGIGGSGVGGSGFGGSSGTGNVPGGLLTDAGVGVGGGG